MPLAGTENAMGFSSRLRLSRRNVGARTISGD